MSRERQTEDCAPTRAEGDEQMPLKTPEQYVESLRALEIRAQVGG